MPLKIRGGVTAALSTDKQSYETGERIKVNLKLSNSGSKDAVIESAEIKVPAGYSLISQKEEFGTVAAGESAEKTFEYAVADPEYTFAAKQKVDVSKLFKAAGSGKYKISSKIGKVSKKGILTCKKPGTATITAGSGESIKIRIEKPTVTKKATASDSTKDANDFISGLENVGVTKWTSSKTSVASVDEKTGEIKVASSGKTKLTALFGEGKNAAKYVVKLSVPKGFTPSGKASTASDDAENADAENTGSSSVTVKINGVKQTLSASVKYSYSEINNEESDPNPEEIRGLNVSEREVNINSENTVTFTVNVPGSDSPAVVLKKEDGTEVGHMSDKGDEGDTAAGDGVYSCEVKLNEKERGEQKYYAEKNGTVRSGKVSVFFFSEISSEEKTALDGKISEISGLESAEEVKKTLEADENMKVTVFDSDKVGYETSSGIKGVWEKAPEVAADGNAKTAKGNAEIPEISEIDDSAEIAAADGDIALNGGNDAAGDSGTSVYRSAEVIRPFHGTWLSYNNFAEQAGNLTGYDPGLIDDENADLAAFKNLNGYSMVFIDSHGFVDNDGNAYIVTGQSFNPDNIDSDNTGVTSADLQSGRVVLYGSQGNYAIGAKWFSRYYGLESLSGTSFFLGSCYSSKDDAIPTALINRGARGVFGFDKPVSVEYCNKNLATVVSALKGGCGEQAAFDKAVQDNGVSDANMTTIPDARFTYKPGETAESDEGWITGQVYDFNSNEPVTAAVVSVLKEDGTPAAEAYVNMSGSFRLRLKAGTYTIKVSAPGYVTDERNGVEVSSGQTIPLADFSMLPAGEGTTAISGTIDDAATSAAIAGAVIKFHLGNNNRTGELLKDASGHEVVLNTDEYGNYSYDSLPYGYYTMEVSYPDYITGYINITAGGETLSRDYSMSTGLKDGEMRVVLWWNEDPRDPDSHMVGPTPGGKIFHTWFSDLHAEEGGERIADLDRDDTTSYGPETTTVRKMTDGRYYFFVHHYAGDKSLTESGAWIEVYIGTELRATYHAPVNQSKNAIYWNVFTYDKETDTLSEVGTITDVPQTGDTGINSYDVDDELDDYYDEDEYDEEPDNYEVGAASVSAGEKASSAVKSESYLQNAKAKDGDFVYSRQD